MKVFALIVLGPTAVLAANWSSYPDKHNCPDITNSMECARFIEGKLDAPYIRRISPTVLVVTLADGGTLELRDNLGEAAGTYISALEAVLEDRYVVLHIQHYEGSSYRLLDRSSGRPIDVPGYPLFSPDGTWMVAANADLDAGYTPNALRLYRNRDGALEVILDAAPRQWGPMEVRWESPTKLTFVRATFEC